MYGRVAIITDTAQGIGRELAFILAKAGSDVVIVDMVDKLFEVDKEIEKM